MQCAAIDNNNISQAAFDLPTCARLLVGPKHMFQQVKQATTVHWRGIYAYGMYISTKSKQ